MDRSARFGAFASVAAALALGGHVAGGGTAPGAGAVLVALLVPGVVAPVLTRRARWSPLDVTLWLAVVQVVVHTVLSSGGHHHGGVPAAGGRPGGLLMVAGHAVAVLAAGTLLAHADAATAALRHVLSALPPVVRAAAPWTPPARGDRPRLRPEPVVVRPAAAARTTPLVRRGPPAAVVR